ncbi:MAG: DNA primase [Gemmatimonadota bacterium]|jgi:DNA primase|nr:DNA primase [Gemmatimonadota bacterium]
MIPDEVVEQVADAADIVAIVGEHVRLKRTGNSWRGPCPFHGGKGPNFSVQPGKGYKCFVCGESGSVFTFLQKHLGLSFVEAVKQVGERVGVEVREVSRARDDEPDWRAPHWELHAAAAEWFTRILWEDPRGAVAREYLAGRGIGRAEGERFGLGYAPREIGAMRQHLASLGMGVERQLESGLLVRRDEAEEPRPRFRERLMIPILDVQGHHVGFGGRLLGPGEPKYLNSADSPVFSKGKLLYLLHAARPAIRKHGRAIVVEGYFDAIRLHLAGIEEAVAPMGTALTEEQAEALARLSPTVFLCYDADTAGQKATFRSGLELLRHGVAVRVVSFPEGEDPDSFVAAFGSPAEAQAAMARRLDEAVDLFERQVQLLAAHGYFGDLHRKRQAVDKLLPTIRACRDDVTRELYLARLADVTGVDRAALLRELDTPPRRPGAAPGPAAREVPPRDAPPPEAEFPDERGRERWTRGGRGRGGRDDAGWRSVRGRPTITAPGTKQVQDLLLVMVHARRFVEEIAETVVPEDLASVAGREVFLALVAEPEATVEDLAARLSPEAVDLLQDLLALEGAVGNPDLAKDRTMTYFRERRLKARMGQLQQALHATEDDGEKTALLAEIARLKRESTSIRSS